MKKITNFLIFSLLLSFTFFSCKKTDVQPSNTTSVNSSGEVSLSVTDENSILTLRPGATKGQDAYVAKETGVQSGNLGDIPELSIAAWTVGGNLYNAESYLRFKDLNIIPPSATIVSAKLYLYSLSSSLSTPQGNSGDNGCYVRRVVAPWDESTITYNNRPRLTDSFRVSLPPSTSQWNYNPVLNVTHQVAYMVANPDRNFGFCIRLITETPYRSLVFGSSEQSNENLHPKLVIAFK